ncbi:Uu.00g009630.m01.CDS01 [Anthostomella pinea]|uniref:Uu.00g009630.m01.CDS01 n=1 Tax=Anthostomella pinea TaxID=933095 RepID=A0AAI8YPW1_9PEZI|nr:Uu.00g009630.m01.CDS01 [Anthostomella pinea]
MRVNFNRVAAVATALAVWASAATGAVATHTYSKWMASSIMSRHQGIMTGAGSSSEALQSGFTQKAFTALVAQYPNATDVQQYIETSVAAAAPFLSNATYDAMAYPMDRLSNGNALLTLPSANSTASNRAAAKALHQSIMLNHRNIDGGLWYFTYPQWSYLDGMYSLAPFWTLYSTNAVSRSSNSTAELDDMLFQLDLIWQHTYNSSTGLLVHGYDASLTAVWANPITGASPHVWGRSLGWYAMALVDTLELLPSSPCKYKQDVLNKFQTLMPAIIDAVDQQTGGWWQILDEPGKEGNYIESSGSAMFAYALLKGVRLGYLAGGLASNASEVATRAQGYLTDTFVVKETNGTLSYNGTVSVCSLNSTASYEYYVGQPIQYNSVLGSAAYVLASLEVEKLSA